MFGVAELPEDVLVTKYLLGACTSANFERSV
jgi:hypothetical protein